MLEIGEPEGNYNLDSADVKTLELIKGFNRNRVVIVHGGDTPLDIDNANEIKKLEIMPFKRWKVLAMALYWIEASTANEDPVIWFGRVGDGDAYGKMTAIITGGEKFNIADHTKYDPLELVAPEVMLEASATFNVTWTEGVEFGVWQTSPANFSVAEAAVAGMTSGKVRPYMIIEVDSGGKW